MYVCKRVNQKVSQNKMASQSETLCHTILLNCNNVKFIFLFFSRKYKIWLIKCVNATFSMLNFLLLSLKRKKKKKKKNQNSTHFIRITTDFPGVKNNFKLIKPSL